MKVVVFESEPREAPVFERLGPAYDLSLVAEPLGRANVERYAEAEAISTFFYLLRGARHCGGQLDRIQVAVNGYGVIGKRVADGVTAQEDMARKALKAPRAC